ncbi:MAG: hypothetical protein QOF51_339 [Chloroflexota bacterium]|nr:hypothetical protein [Chloroflexota bacterium]
MYQVPPAGSEPLPDAPSAGTGAFFVGRQHELTELRSALAEAAAGRGRICMLAGEPGIGKSRTAQELAAHAARAGCAVLWGRCYESSGAPPYWPWVQVIRAYMQAHDADALRSVMGARATSIAEIVPELRDKLADLPHLELVQDPDAARFRLFDAIAGFLRAAVCRKPLVFVLDNLHAADKPSPLLLEFLAPEVGASRLLILGTPTATSSSPSPTRSLRRSASWRARRAMAAIASCRCGAWRRTRSTASSPVWPACRPRRGSCAPCSRTLRGTRSS